MPMRTFIKIASCTLMLALIFCSHVDAQSNVHVDFFAFGLDGSSFDRVPISSNATFQVAVGGVFDSPTFSTPTTTMVDRFDLTFVTDPGLVTPPLSATGLGDFNGASSDFTIPLTEPEASLFVGGTASLVLPMPVALSDLTGSIAEFSLDTNGLSEGDLLFFGLASSQFFIGDEPITSVTQLSYHFFAEAVPEPSSLCVLFGLGCIAATRRKRAS